MSNNSVTSAKSNRAKVKQKSYSKSHMIIPIEDTNWLLEQKPSVIKLFIECWRADPYGSRWMQLNTSLKRTAFTEAKKILEEQGLFIFRPTKSIRNSRETIYWSVKNLHGARVKEYWESVESLEFADTNKNNADANTDNADANENTAYANSISSQTLTQQDFQKPSVTSQEHLSNSSEELLRCAPEENPKKPSEETSPSEPPESPTQENTPSDIPDYVQEQMRLLREKVKGSKHRHPK